MYCPKCGSENEDQAKFCQSCGAFLEKETVKETVVINHYHTSKPYAGFWLRFVASFIDGLVFIIPSFILNALFGYAASLFGLAGGWLYYALMESSNKQATLGKMALGLYVSDLNGNKISFGRATGRYFGNGYQL